ncbi:hypothetical protein [Streptomyces sp. NPDC059009]|uniref:hypothetical protein n=1 Tax=Streptomyces sp. NPDC059009 TaxID=3346694 RepID=UPI00369FD2AB
MRIIPRRRPRLDRGPLLDQLPPVEYRRSADEQELFEEASLAHALLLMLKVDQEAEYLLCREVAERAIGSVPGPDDLPG